jgi:Flp pilus assembly pilin Flp
MYDLRPNHATNCRINGYQANLQRLWMYRALDEMEYEMKLFKLNRHFWIKEDGAVTVDWVVLTAAICGLGVAVMSTLRGNMGTVGSKISDHLNSATIKTTFD